jgi:branched-chain amino acid transport system ATP-binding protein
MLEVNNLRVQYEKAIILHDISLKVEEGETVGVLGPNGAGKTTLLRAISGLAPTTGEIVFNGERINGLPPYKIVEKGIVMCPEHRRLFRDMTTEDNLLMGAFLRKDSNNIQKDLEFVYKLFPRLEERRDQVVKTMSGGEQQMVAIGRALMARPTLLLLDEPSIGLAPIVIQAITESIKKIKETGTTILLVEQNVHMAIDLVERLYILSRGHIEKEGTKEELKDEIEKAYLEM